MKSVTVETTVQRPIEEVYDHLEVLANHEAFTDHFLTDWRLSGPGESGARSASTACVRRGTGRRT